MTTNKRILIILLLITLFIPISFAIPIYVKPIVNGNIATNTDFNYVFNFTNNYACTDVILSNKSIITTDGTGVGFIDINITYLTTVPKYICEYRQGVLRKVHNNPTVIFNKILVNGDIVYSGTLLGTSPAKINQTNITNEAYFNSVRNCYTKTLNNGKLNCSQAPRNGTAGMNGSQGIQGIQGLTGLAGRNGTAGINGSKGQAGQNGTNGLQNATLYLVKTNQQYNETASITIVNARWLVGNTTSTNKFIALFTGNTTIWNKINALITSNATVNARYLSSNTTLTGKINAVNASSLSVSVLTSLRVANASLRVSNATQALQIDSLLSSNTSQTNQLIALRASNDSQALELAGLRASNLTSAKNVTSYLVKTSFNLYGRNRTTISCSNITGGSDADYCADATGTSSQALNNSFKSSNVTLTNKIIALTSSNTTQATVIATKLDVSTFNINMSLKAHNGTCAAGTVMQNATPTGVQCVTPPAGAELDAVALARIGVVNTTFIRSNSSMTLKMIAMFSSNSSQALRIQSLFSSNTSIWNKLNALITNNATVNARWSASNASQALSIAGLLSSNLTALKTTTSFTGGDISSGTYNSLVFKNNAMLLSAQNVSAGTFGTGNFIFTGVTQLENITFEKDTTNHRMYDNTTCIIIMGDTSTLRIC